MSRDVRASLPFFFGSATCADCVIVFCVADEQAQNESSGLRVVGEPLPAHRLVLWSGSKRFRVMIEGWNQHDTNNDEVKEPSAKRRRVEPAACDTQASNAHDKPAFGGSGSTAQPQHPVSLSLPELRVTLDREEELEPALAAIRYLYTGSLVGQQDEQGQGQQDEQGQGQQGRLGQGQQQEQRMQDQDQVQGSVRTSGGSSGPSVGELVVIGHMAESLEIADCAEACYAALAKHFQDASKQSSSSSPDRSPLAPVLELYNLRHLLPSPEHHPRVGPVVVACRERLLQHWDAQLPPAAPSGATQPTKVHLLVWLLGSTDAVRIANDPQLLRPWEELPVGALEEWLQSDHLTTDDEATLVLLVAKWRQAQHYELSDADKARVWRQLRLVNCSTSYMFDVLPKMDWLGPEEATFLARCRMMNRSAWKHMGQQIHGYDTDSPLYGMPRPQRPVQGAVHHHSYSWEVSKEDLLSALQKAQPRVTVHAQLKQPGSCGGGTDCVTAFGFEWGLSLEHVCGSAHAALHVRCSVPFAIEWQAEYPTGACCLSADVTMPDGAGGTCTRHLRDVHVKYGDSMGWPDAMCLEVSEPGAAQQGQQERHGQQGQQGQQGQAAEAVARDTEAELLAPWSKLLGPDGMISGTLQFLALASEAGEEAGKG